MPAFSVATLLLGLLLIACLSTLQAQQALGSRGLSRLALLGYIVTLLYVTVLSRQSILETRLQLIPFFEFNRFKGVGFVDNMILFVPAGALFLLSVCPLLPRGLVFGFLLSLGIESIQYVTRRGVADIDDLIANTLGAALGAIFCLGVQQLNRLLFPPDNA